MAETTEEEQAPPQVQQKSDKLAMGDEAVAVIIRNGKVVNDREQT
jgi:hypothetical protein